MRHYYDKYTSCSVCGQVGRQLVKKDDNVYECADVKICAMRQNAAGLNKICSTWWCTERATKECSCRMFLCPVHATSRVHKDHVFKVFK